MNAIFRHIGDRKNLDIKKTMSATTTKLYNMEELNALSGGDKDYLTKLVELFIRQTDNSLRQMKTALAVRDLKTVFEVSHQMKPAIDGFKIECLKLEVREIEKDAKEGKYSVKLENLVSYADEILNSVIADLKKEFRDEDEHRTLYEYQP